MDAPAGPDNRTLLLPYLLPYALYVGAASLPVPAGWSYALCLIAVTAALVWGWRRYAPFRGPRSSPGSVLIGVATGGIATALWVLVAGAFAGTAGEPPGPNAIVLRIVAATALAPLAEELLLRGYVLRVAVQWDRARAAGEPGPLDRALSGRLTDVEPGAWSVNAVTISTVAFALGHRPFEWPAAALFGLLMAILWIRRGDLLACVVAHATTNLLLGLYVVKTGSWELW